MIRTPKKPTIDTNRLLAPLQAPGFRRLAVGKGVSSLGDWLMVAALVGWVYGRSHSTGAVAALMVVRLLPPILGGGIASSIADRISRKALLVGGDFGAAVAVAGVLAGVLVESLPLVFVAAALCGLAATTGAVAANAFPPLLVKPEQLTGANTILTVAQEIAMILGAVLAGVVLAAGAAPLAVAGNLVTYAIAVALYARIPRSDDSIVALPARRGGDLGLRAGLRYLRSSRALLGIAASLAVVTLATGLVNASLPSFFAARGLGTAGYGYGLAALAFGSLIGQLALDAATERVETRWLAWSMAGMAALFVCLGAAPSAGLALAALGLFGCANGVFEVVLLGAVQQEADQRFHGRMFGLVTTLSRTTMLGAVAAAPLVAQLGTARTPIFAAAAALLVGACVVVARLRTPALQPQAA